MAYYALLDENNIVTRVIFGLDENDNENWEEYYSKVHGQVCKRTSYNTRLGVHENGKQPFRKNFASREFIYDETRDAFIPPKPFKYWILDEQTCYWFPPTGYPYDGQQYCWSDEDYEQTRNGWVLKKNL